MDKISICDLRLPVIVGTLEHERKFPQNVTIHLEFEYDTRRAGESDNLADAVDYSMVEERVIDYVSHSSFQLLEALAEGIAALCLNADPRIESAKVAIEKPAAARRAHGIRIEIERRKKHV